FVVYNAIMKWLASKVLGAAICLVLYAAVWALLECVGHYGGRALYIHGGATFGTMMALNVWMVIWPYQKKIITALKDGSPLPADDPIVKTAGLRSRHNTFMSVPLVFFMISNHYATVFGSNYRDLYALAIIVIGFLLRWFTPTVEVNLCGHATLASAHALWSENVLASNETARFHTRSGLLTAQRDGDLIELDFPATPAEADTAPAGLLESLGIAN